MRDLHLVPIETGALALSHRPRIEDFAALRAAGVTHVVTLLDETEGARQIGDAATLAGMGWSWIPLAGGIPAPTRSAELRQVLGELRALLRAGHKLFIHCSAGIQRTGMFSYALLRQLGWSAEAAHVALVELRQVTAAGVGPHRLAWGDALAEAARAQEP